MGGQMAEWSKAVDLRSTIFGCVGSNPTLTNLLFIIIIYYTKYLILYHSSQIYYTKYLKRKELKVIIVYYIYK